MQEDRLLMAMANKVRMYSIHDRQHRCKQMLQLQKWTLTYVLVTLGNIKVSLLCYHPFVNLYFSMKLEGRVANSPYWCTVTKLQYSFGNNAPLLIAILDSMECRESWLGSWSNSLWSMIFFLPTIKSIGEDYKTITVISIWARLLNF